jgi:hypothetical protein
MKKEKDEEVDKLFKKELQDPVNEAAYRENDWDALEQMLDKSKKRAGIIYWLPVTIGIAALLLLFLGLWMFRSPVKNSGKQDQQAVNHPKKDGQPATKQNDTGISGGPARLAADSSKQKIQTPANYAVNPQKRESSAKSKSFFTLSPGKDRRNTGQTGQKKDLGTADENGKNNAELASVTNKQKDNTALAIKNGQFSADTNVKRSDNLASVTNKPKDNNLPGIKTNPGNADTNKTNPATSIASVPNKQKDTGLPRTKKDLGTADFRRPVFAVTAIASSDMNGVNSFGGRLGGNFGGLFAVTFNKWTISTGGMYSIKPYSTPFDNYHTGYKFPVDPASVDANCRMIDIPLNVNYQVYSQRGNRFTVGTGLSSYLILREDYHFNYAATDYNTGPVNYSVINKNKNILGIVNLDATYEHQVSSRMGVVIQPYLKIPLSNVGASQAKLQSTGVAVGLTYDINSFRKPK